MRKLFRRSRTKVGYGTIALTAIVSLFAQLVVVTPTAHAEINSNIVISEIKIQSADSRGNLTGDGNQQLMQGLNAAKISFKYDAGHESVTNGSQFNVKVPSFLGTGADQKLDLEVPYNGGKVKVANCVLNNATGLTCTFNDRVDVLRKLGFTGFKGDISFVAGIQNTHDQNRANISVNGRDVEVALPADKPVGKLNKPYGRAGFGKDAGNLIGVKGNLGWGVNFNSALIQQELAKIGDDRVFDGKKVHTLTFLESAGPGQEFDPNLANWILKFKGNAEIFSKFNGNVPTPCLNVILATGTRPGVVTTDNNGSGCNTAIQQNNVDFTMPDGFSISVEFIDTNSDGQADYKDSQARIRVTGPFDPDTNYSINPQLRRSGYNEAGPSGQEALAVKEGMAYENNIVLEDTKQSSSFVAKAFQTLTGTINMANQFGTFSVRKYLQGEGIENVQPSDKFTINGTWTLPNGNTVASYPGWQPQTADGVEITINGDQAAATSGTITFKLAPGERKTAPAPHFPVGTEITLSEDMQTAPKPGGIEWEEAEFLISNRVVEPTFKIQNQKNTEIEVFNKTKRETGKLRVKKVLSGLPAAQQQQAATDEFTFEYRCGVGTNYKEISNVSGSGAELEVPGDFPVGTLCNVREKFNPQAPHTVGDFIQTAMEPAVVTIKKDGVVAAVTNKYARLKGGFRIAKDVTGDAEVQALAGIKSFTFSYDCQIDNQSVAKADNVTVTPGEPADITGVDVGAECVVSEPDANNNGEIDGYTLTRPQEQRFVIAKQSTPENNVKNFTNAYELKRGGFSVVKRFADPKMKDLLKSETVDFNFTCKSPLGEASNLEGDAQAANGKIAVPKDGTAKVITGIPVGHKCEVTEVADSATVKNYTHNPLQAQTAVVVENPSAPDAAAESKLTFTNEYTAKTAKFAVTKQAELAPGQDVYRQLFDQQLQAKGEFEFSYTCSVPNFGAPKTMRVAAGGQKVESAEEYPIGSQCTITENLDQAQLPGFNAPTVNNESITVTIAEEGEPVVTAAFTNTYNRKSAGLKLQKTFTDGRPHELNADHKFPVKWSCNANSTSGPDTYVAGTKVAAELPASGALVDTGYGFAEGTECVISDEEVQLTNDLIRAGYTAEAPQYTPLTITAGVENIVGVTNTYTKQVGTFGVRKTVAGDNAAAFAKNNFSFTYVCAAPNDAAKANAINGAITVAGDGVLGNEKSKEIPVGWICELTETSAVPQGYTVNTEIKKPPEIAPGDGNIFNVTNTYTQQTGGFKVKKVTNDGLFTGTEFRVSYTCDNDPGSNKELMVPANGEAVVVDKLPTGTSCTISESPDDAAKPGYTVASTIDTPQVTVEADQVKTVTVTNTYADKIGGLNISHTATGNAAPLGSKELVYTVTGTPDKGGDPITKTVNVKAGETVTVSDLPAGTYTVTQAEPQAPAPVVIGTTINTEPGPSVQVKVSGNPGETAEVAAINNYTLATGSLTLSKTVTTQEHADRSFTFDYACESPLDPKKIANSVSAKADGTEVEVVKSLPYGSTCTISEDLEKNAIEGYTIAPVPAKTISINAATQKVEIENTITRDTAPLSLAKVVTGNEDFAKKEFTFRYTCTDTGNKETEIKVLGDGKPVTVRDAVPTGTSCTFTEDEEKAAEQHYFLNMEPAKTVTVTKRDTPVTVSFTNTYTQKPYWIAGLILIPAIIGGAAIIADLAKKGHRTAPATPAPGAEKKATDPQGDGAQGPAKKGVAKDGATAPHAAAPKGEAAGKATAPGKSQPGASGSLARTGASVLGVLAAALLVIALGVFFIRRGRNTGTNGES
ncbi:T surface-antigen of pili [Corynebacterium mustelae]|uniref:T surface-antigen of pili n=1 Tax=Corynebacterium mustelae TaxID=571915 RepID=A0A0G3H0A4_9CORY|nr:DUF5979 domain-containing protein [Corynebacterium mustelae]AKK04537.1 T surface-antigen of pili [Corynebacterium mustelae]